MGLAVVGFGVLWMSEEFREDGVMRFTGPSAGVHGCGSGVVPWSMDAGSSPA